ncbi:Importin alpha subunit (Karyopherin alpha subunit) (Serine-rich RNA polymerase I suppressor protein) [Actinomortierella ambigua]|uniref:Importin alpha subunit (Karyopherin alpha subunit) (Serine-rich RNA polymerase I suppressor protein) n=1 Tax=Actinomortierella ambigua TaxID=1343610 RepID=A0A9P6PUH8_9FUNG|nr:Importin alpha subunit (Karyopherin alpha subunit) (Serine-rich RNA polymerase I suppressor protein) [Actinomortierella ambigua]
MLKPKGAATQRDYTQNGHDDEEDLIEQLNRKLSNVTLNPTTPIPDEMNMADISTMAYCPDLQTIWALGNISGDGPPFRDLILRSGALEVILQMIEMCEDPTVAKEQKYMILRIAVWGSGRAAPEWIQVTPAFPLLRRLMYIDDTEIIADTCEPHPTIQVPSLRSLINIASGPHDHTQLLIDAKAIPVLGSQELLAHRNSTIRRDALLGISNITAGTLEQVWAVSKEDHGNVMRRVLEILRRGDIGDDYSADGGGTSENPEGGDWRVLREAAWVISNATSVLDSGVTGQMVYEMELLPSLAQLMDPRHPRKPSYVLPAVGLHHQPLLTKLLDIVFNVLRCNEHHPREQFMKIWVTDCDGGQILLELLKMVNPALRDSSAVAGQESTNGRGDNDGVNKSTHQHVRFGNDGRTTVTTRLQGSTNSAWVESAHLGSSVKKRIETILETFFEFGPENDGFGPFFGERTGNGSESRRGSQSAHFGDGYGSDYFDEDDDGYQDSGYHHHHHGNASSSGAVDIEIEEMERQVGRMNIF